MRRDADEAGGIERRIEALGGEIALAELFPDEWIAATTEFNAIPDREWAAFAAVNTEFSCREGMLERALERYVE